MISVLIANNIFVDFTILPFWNPKSFENNVYVIESIQSRACEMLLKMSIPTARRDSRVSSGWQWRAGYNDDSKTKDK